MTGNTSHDRIRDKRDPENRSRHRKEDTRIKRNLPFPRLLSLFILTILISVLISGTEVSAAKKISLNHTTRTMYTGNSLQLKVYEVPASRSSQLVWKSSSPQIATVNSSGKVRAKKAGTVNITVRLTGSKNSKASCKIKIYDKTKDLELVSDSAYTLSVGDFLQLQAKVTGSKKHTKPVSWKSSDYSVASITSNGLVTALRPGSAKMTASSGGRHVSVTITVQNHQDPVTPDIPSDPVAPTVPVTPTVPSVPPSVSCTVTFMTNGGSLISTQTVEYGGTIIRPADPVRAGYTFGGWYRDYSLLSEYDFASPVTRNFTLFAKWLYIQPETCMVVFDTNGGTILPPLTVEKGTKITPPSVPIRYGYTFAGWYINRSFTIPYSFSDAITADTILYAKWDEALKYVVTFDSNGGSYVEPQRVEFLRTALRPNDPVRSGYVFAGWYMNEALTTPYDFSLTITQDITLYARWVSTDNYYPYPGNPSASRYTVTFDTNGGTAVPSQTIASRQFAVRPESPKKSGYVFAGWYTSQNFDEIYIFEYVPVVKDITVYARWIDDSNPGNINN